MEDLQLQVEALEIIEPQFQWKMFFQHLLSGFVPLYEFWIRFKPSEPGKYMMQYSLLMLCAALLLPGNGTASFFLQNAIVCHCIFVLVISTRRAVVCLDPAYPRIPSTKPWGIAIVSQLVALGHVVTLYLYLAYHTVPKPALAADWIPDAYQCTASDYLAMGSIYIAVGGYMYAFFKSMTLFGRRYDRLDRLAPISHPPTLAKLVIWKHARFDIDTSRRDELLRLLISFLGTATVLGGILVIFALHKMFGTKPILVPDMIHYRTIPWVFLFDAGAIAVGYVLWTIKIMSYEQKTKRDNDMLERHLSYMRDANASSNAISAYLQAQTFLAANMGALDASAIKMGHQLTIRIIQYAVMTVFIGYISQK